MLSAAKACPERSRTGICSCIYLSSKTLLKLRNNNGTSASPHPSPAPGFQTPKFFRRQIAFNYVQCAHNGTMPITAANLSPGSISLRAADAFHSSTPEPKAPVQRQKTYTPPPGVLNK